MPATAAFALSFALAHKCGAGSALFWPPRISGATADRPTDRGRGRVAIFACSRRTPLARPSDPQRALLLLLLEGMGHVARVTACGSRNLVRALSSKLLLRWQPRGAISSSIVSGFGGKGRRRTVQAQSHSRFLPPPPRLFSERPDGRTAGRGRLRVPSG